MRVNEVVELLVKCCFKLTKGFGEADGHFVGLGVAVKHVIQRITQMFDV